MTNHVVDFYSNLYAAEDCDNDCMIQLFQGLPQLNCDSKTALDANITFKEVSDAVANLNIGRSNGMYGLLADFYKSFWSCIGEDLFDVFCECMKDGVLFTSCQYAVLSLLPKKWIWLFLRTGVLLHFLQRNIKYSRNACQID